MKKFLALLLALAMVLSCTACGTPDTKGTTAPSGGDVQNTTATLESAEPVTLTVLTQEELGSEGQGYGGMNYLLETLAEKFMEEHQNVTIEITYIPHPFGPGDPSEREIQLKQLRTEQIAGKGADIFLFPSEQQMGETSFFKDPKMAMYNGHFLDISTYYDQDEALGKEELNRTVMDVGVLDGKRYILPMYYDLPVLSFNEAKLAEYGLKPEDISENIMTLSDKIFPLQELLLSDCLSYYRLDAYFGNIVDYETQTTNITPQELEIYLSYLQKYETVVQEMTAIGMQAMEDEEPDPFPDVSETNLSSYQWCNSEFWNEYGLPFHLDDMKGALDSTVLNNALELEATQIPLKNSRNKITASVTYWGAVGSSCDNPDIAYAFLREFLTQEFQWDQIRPSFRTGSLGAGGYPVRKGAAPHLLESHQKAMRSSGGDTSIQRFKLIKQATLEEGDFGMEQIDAEIDEVKFYSVYDDLLNMNTGGGWSIPMGEMAVEAIRLLNMHLAES